MKTSNFRALGFATLTGLAAIAAEQKADAAPIQAPVLVKDKHVYTVPEGFNPPNIGVEGMKQIETAVSHFHHSYYVVLVDEVDGPKDNKKMDKVMDGVIDGIANTWRTSYPALFDEKSSLFVQAAKPRKFRILAGSKFRAELSLRNNSYGKYEDIFKSFARGTSPDYVNGIIKSGSALDEYLFDQTDPGRIAARAEAKRVALEAEKARVEAERKRKAEAAALAAAQRAEEAKQAADRKAEEDRLAAIKKAEEEKARAEQERIDAENRAKMMAQLQQLLVGAGKGLAVLALLLSPPLLVMRRKKKFEQLSKGFQKKLGDLDKKIGNALLNFVAFDEDRTDVAKFESLTGKTKELFDRVTAEVDEISIGLEAMKDHLEECKALSQKASWLNQGPLLEAEAKLEAGIQFNTGKLNSDKLFAPREEVVELKPDEFIESFGARYAKAMKGWKLLTEARQIQKTEVEEAFKAEDYQAMSANLAERKIPEHWLEGHPLHGEQTKYYGGLRKLRDADPLAYKIKLESDIDQGKEALGAADAVLKMSDELAGLEKTVLERVPEMVVPEKYDPQKSLVEVGGFAAEFRDLLKGKNAGLLKEKVGEAAHAVAEARRRVNLLKASVERSAATIAEVQASKVALDRAQSVVDGLLREVSEKFDGSVVPAVNVAVDLKSLAESKLDGLVKLREQKNYIAVQETADDVKFAFKTANSNYDQVAGRCREMLKMVTDAEANIAQAAKAGDEMTTYLTNAEGKIALANGNHPAGLIPTIGSGNFLKEAAGALLAEARQNLSKREYQIAGEKASLSGEKYEQAKSLYKAAADRCAQLDALKLRLNGQITDMPGRHEEAVRRITRYGGSQQLSAFQGMNMATVLDYEDAIRRLEREAASWKEAADAAQEEYEAEQERIRREEERRREAEEARLAAEARARAAEAARIEAAERRAAEELAAAAAALAAAAARAASRSRDYDDDNRGYSRSGGGSSESYSGGGNYDRDDAQSDAGGGDYGGNDDSNSDAGGGDY